MTPEEEAAYALWVEQLGSMIELETKRGFFLAGYRARANADV